MIKTFLKNLTSGQFTIKSAYNKIKNFISTGFGDDICHVGDFLTNRMNLEPPLNMKKDYKVDNQLLDRGFPAINILNLQKCQITTVSVERSFSLLGDIFSKKGNVFCLRT